MSGLSTLYAVGEVVPFQAVALFTDGSMQDQTNASTWETSDAAVATVSSSGHVSAVAAGTADIKATFGGRSGIRHVDITPPNWRFVGAPTLTEVDLGVQFIAVDPRDEATLYVGTSLGLYVTRNGGGSWERPLAGFIKAIALTPANPDRVYAVVNADALVRSDDRGATFVTVKIFDDIIDSLLVSKRSPGTIYLGFGGFQNPSPSGTFKSIDDGATWMRQPFGVNGFLIVWEMGEDASSGVMYAGTEIADHPKPYHPPFFRSPDGGGTWIDATGSLPWHVIHIAVSAASHAVLAQTEGAGLYKSVDGAQTWRLLNNVFDSALFVDPGDETRVFGGEIVFRTSNGGAFVSQDSADHFFPYGLEGQSVAAFAMNGSRTRLYAACYNAGIYVTNLGL